MRAIILVDLGFGDSGKGLLTDYLVRRTGATVVIRYNGGAQAGHNVVTRDGRHHTFAQFGAGTFAGARTFLSRHVVVHPPALLREGELLRAKGVVDAFRLLRVSEEARLITPYHQAAGRLRELARGGARHGSCGVGVGEVVRADHEHPEETVRARDLRAPAPLRSKLRRVRERLREEIETLREPPGPVAARERSVFERDDVLDRWLSEAARLVELDLLAPDAALAEWMQDARCVVFEGAQGVLLDEWHGFHPYTTWSRCTPDNALELLAEMAPQAEVERIGVLRAHAVRHGPGPLPTETGELAAAVCEHNGDGEWQGRVRYGWFDPVLVRYALDVVGPLEGVALTHVDTPSRLGTWRVGAGYRLPAAPETADLVPERTAGGRVDRLVVPAGRCLARQARLTELLEGATPCLEECAPTAEGVLETTERLLSRPIDLVSRGPRAGDVTSRADQR
ncbi:MAG: adenylosuccinate synthetase [Thermoanaerobaculia bacterium]